MSADTTPLAQRLRLAARMIDSEAAISARPGQLDRLEALASDVRDVADQLVEHVAQTRQVYDLFAALVLGMNKTFRPEVPADDDFSFVLVASEDVEEVQDRWQVEVRDHPGGYALALVGRALADSIEEGEGGDQH